MMAARGARGEEASRPARGRGREDELELANLVAPIELAGEIVPLDPQLDAATRERVEALDGRGVLTEHARCPLKDSKMQVRNVLETWRRNSRGHTRSRAEAISA